MCVCMCIYACVFKCVYVCVSACALCGCVVDCMCYSVLGYLGCWCGVVSCDAEVCVVRSEICEWGIVFWVRFVV